MDHVEEDVVITMVAVMVATMTAAEIKRGHAWVGGIRTAACVGKPQGGPCTAKTAFQWTDHSTTGTEGFVFSIGQPSNIQLGQDCLLLWNAEIPVYQNAQPGLMITWSCVATTPLINSYVCGKKAT
uniref:C-type lectin domain-containing protein n=1 Tax=Caenorhabditis japonica TaxID=281687 RepID=A0A8R1ICG2_CAEJA